MRFLRQLLLALTLPLTATVVVVVSIVLGVATTVTVPLTFFGALGARLGDPGRRGSQAYGQHADGDRDWELSHLFLSLASWAIPHTAPWSQCGLRAVLAAPGSAARARAASRSAISPANAARRELLEQPAHLGARLDPQLGGELVAAERGARRAVAVPVERRGRASRAPARGGPRSSRGSRAGPRRGPRAGRRRVSRVTSARDRLGRAQVLVDGAARERALVDQEAEAQVVQREALQVPR